MILDMKFYLFLFYIFIIVYELYIIGFKVIVDFCFKRLFYVDFGFIYFEVFKLSKIVMKCCNEYSGFIYRNLY